MNQLAYLLHPTTWPEVAGLLILALFAGFVVCVVGLLLYIIVLGFLG